jgi:hypothetical protein
MSLVEQKIDRWVEKLRGDGQQIERSQQATHLAALHERIGVRLPPSYEALVSRYRFRALEVNDILLFGTDDSDRSIWHTPFLDQNLSTPLLKAGLVQIGRPADGRYDLVCFDSKVRAQNRECPIVLIDHEQVLQFSRTNPRHILLKNFYELMAITG